MEESLGVAIPFSAGDVVRPRVRTLLLALFRLLWSGTRPLQQMETSVGDVRDLLRTVLRGTVVGGVRAVFDYSSLRNRWSTRVSTLNNAHSGPPLLRLEDGFPVIQRPTHCAFLDSWPLCFAPPVGLYVFPPSTFSRW